MQIRARLPVGTVAAERPGARLPQRTGKGLRARLLGAAEAGRCCSGVSRVRGSWLWPPWGEEGRKAPDVGTPPPRLHRSLIAMTSGFEPHRPARCVSRLLWKLKLREVKGFLQGHTASRPQSLAFSWGLLNPTQAAFHHTPWGQG